MVNQLAVDLDDVFRALANGTRRDLLRQLRSGERTVTDLAACYEISLPAVSKHLKVLSDAGLLQQRKVGRIHLCRLNPDPLRAVDALVEEYRVFWEQRLDALETYLEQEAPDGQ